VEQELLTRPEHMCSLSVCRGFVLLDVVFCRSLFLLFFFLLVIVLSVLRTTAFYFLFAIFKPYIYFILSYNILICIKNIYFPPNVFSILFMLKVVFFDNFAQYENYVHEMFVINFHIILTVCLS
jgi:hypothetical protein